MRVRVEKVDICGWNQSDARNVNTNTHTTDETVQFVDYIDSYSEISRITDSWMESLIVTQLSILVTHLLIP